jgi:hypothetical protein
MDTKARQGPDTLLECVARGRIYLSIFLDTEEISFPGLLRSYVQTIVLNSSRFDETQSSRILEVSPI